MDIVVQADNLRSFRAALASRCQGVRLGSEFCEQLLPARGELVEAYGLAQRAGKPFVYVTPRVSDAGIERLTEHLAFLNEQGPVPVVFNDLGMLNLLGRYPHLVPHLGRHLLVVPSRTPWAEQQLQREDLTIRRRQWLQSLYASTSLNYRPTMELYRRFGCERADIDWIPSIFPALPPLIEHGFRLSVQLYLVPATLTRKCHTARFLGEESPEACSKPCLQQAFIIRNDPFQMELYLHGNAAFWVIPPSVQEAQALEEWGVADLVLPMSPLTRVEGAEAIDRWMTEMGL